MSIAPTRRQVNAGLFSIGVASSLAGRAHAQSTARIVIIGGGFGGATAARTVKRLLPSANVTLIEASSTYTACPFSNLVIGGWRELSAQQFSYAAIAAEGINVVQARADDVDPAARTVTLNNRDVVAYDRLILSPGIDLRWDGLDGYDEAASRALPHAWKAGDQTLLLARQLDAMEDGGTVVMSVPPAPFRCPPGPYERASLIAQYLKQNKPRSKLLVLDAKDSFSKMPLFMEAWTHHYPDHLEWRGGSADGRVVRVDASSRMLFTDFEDVQADVANVIPPQKTGFITQRAGVSDATGWCPINAVSFESTLQQGIHIIGDAAIAAPMPKSAFSANLQGKICAIAVVRMLLGLPVEPTVLANTCYSYTTPEEAISIVGVYTNQNGGFVSQPSAGGLSPSGADTTIRRQEAAQAEAWFNAITGETFG